MKAQIHITGQPNGNSILLSKLNNGTYKTGMFNSYFINFDSVGEAKQALRKAWIEIKSENDNLHWRNGIINNCTQLVYDSSKAVLTKHYKNEDI